MDVYVDESGDLGFSEKSTKFFVVAYLVCNSSVGVRTEMKRILKRLHEKGFYHCRQNELKFCKMDDNCRKIVLHKIAKFDVSLGAIVVEKRHVKLDLREKLPVLYNYLVVHHIISALVPSLEAGQRIHITFDKSLPKARVTDFNHYVEEKASYLFYEKGNSLPNNCLYSDHADSKYEPCLQAADSVAGAYFHKYEDLDASYVEIIKDVTSFMYLWRK
ncbi:MAG: DUF3800 domain-containing protein [Candidatus Bathyarchaeia archaeon]